MGGGLSWEKAAVRGKWALEESCAMLHALALTSLLATQPAPAGSSPSAAPKDACEIASIDPSFVRYVPPATRANGRDPLLWWVSSKPILVHDDR
jgi:hypothetical protein